MTSRLSGAVLVFLAGCGPSATEQIGAIKLENDVRFTESQKALQDSDRAVIAKIAAPLSAFETAQPKSCNSTHLREAYALGATAALNYDAQRHGVDLVHKIADQFLRVGDVAKRAGCKEVARNVYDQVLKIYIGSAYAAHRQRAQIGIDDLRKS